MESDPIELVLGKLDGVRQHGGYWMARCPAHEDREASLSIARGTEQPVVFKCHAGCERDAILDALGLTLASISNPKPRAERRQSGDEPRADVVATYDYVDEHGELLYQVLRTADKQFPQRRRNAKGDWTWKLGNVRRVPYRLPALIAAASAGRTIYVVEGEKDAQSIERAGGVATTSPGGAGKWRPEYAPWFKGANVLIIADRDSPGRAHAKDVMLSLLPVAASVAVLEPLSGKDATDHLEAGHGLDDFAPPVTVDGAALLDDVHAFLGRFVAYPSEAAHVAHTLWVAHTWLMGVWDSTPRIAFLSPEPGSGKSRALEVTELLVPQPVIAVNTTPAYLFRKVSDPDGMPTILYDEIDTVFGPRTAKDNEDIRGLLNAGHRKGAVAGRCVIKGKTVETEELPAYCAVALAGLGDLPDTLLSRSVIIRMRRRSHGERVEPFRQRLHKIEAAPLYERLQSWSDQVFVTWPEFPDGITDRDADVWEALLAIADSARGDWPARARVAAVALVADSKAAPPSLGVRLLADLRQVFGESDALSTEAILTALRELDEAPWGDLKGKPLDARGLAQRLKPYGVKSQTVRVGESTPKGYLRADLWDPWDRYLPERQEIIGGSAKESATSAASATLCEVCGYPLDPVLVADGLTTHGELALVDDDDLLP